MSDAPAPLLINRFARAITTYEAQAVAQRTSADHLAALLGRHCHTLAPRILEIGCGTGFLTRQLMARFAPAELVANDICPDMAICFANVPRITFLPGDARALTWPGTFDVIASASAVQWFSDLPAFARQCAEALPKGGLVAIATFGPQTLHEVTALTGRGLTYPTFEAFQAAFTSSGFTTLEAERQTLTVPFPDAMAVLRHLRETGVTATSAGDAPWTRSRMSAFANDYASAYTVEGGVRLTYEPFWYVGVRV